MGRTLKLSSRVGFFAVMMTAVGCASTPPQYQGASPSLRSVSGSPDTRYSYVGMNFKFAVDQSTGYHRTPDNDLATASAE